MTTLTIPAKIINGAIVPSRVIPPQMLQKNIQVTITLSDTKVSQDDMMTPANKRAYKAAMEDLKAGKNVVTIPSTLTTGDDFLSFLQKYDD